DVFVSYISEVPIWKSTYRIIFPDKPGEKPLLQGWAIVDNTIGEDWKDVQLSLVAGAPQSFVQNISQPFYTRRPVIALPESVMLTPQSHEASLQVAEPIPASGLGGDVSGGTAGALRAGGVLSSLQGVVKDPAGAVIPGARVTVRNEETGASQVMTTDSRGHYSFSNVQAGNSALFVSSPGFKRYDLSNFYLGVGRTVSRAGRMGDDERHSQAGGIFGVIPPLSSSGRSRQVGGVNGGIVSSSGNDLRTNKPRFRRSRLACPAETAYAGHAAVLQPDSR